MYNKKKVVVGLSGGVDSSVAAYILKEQGFDVVGIFMNNWEKNNEDDFCPAENDYHDVVSICGKIDIPFYTIKFAKEYYENVFKYFLKSLKDGKTPNPDVLCNKSIKFGVFRNYAIKLGANFIATGHYSKLVNNNNNLILERAIDNNKDQSYFLHQVKTNDFYNVLFPLGDIKKTEVRDIAKKLNLSNAEKKDSTGICFIGPKNFREFLSNYLPYKKGDIKDTTGRVVGTHNGLMFYTIGQRRGLNIGGIKDCDSNRWYVVKKDLDKNILWVSNGEGIELLSKSCTIKDLNIIGNIEKNIFECTAKFRYRQPDEKVSVNILNSKAKIIFEKNQRAVVVGQYAVLYDNNRCLGGGEIDSVEMI